MLSSKVIVVVIEYMNVLRSSDVLSCAPTPILFVAVCGDGIEVGTRCSNSTSCSFVVAGNFTSKSSSVGWYADSLSAVIVGL